MIETVDTSATMSGVVSPVMACVDQIDFVLT